MKTFLLRADGVDDAETFGPAGTIALFPVRGRVVWWDDRPEREWCCTDAGGYQDGDESGREMHVCQWCICQRTRIETSDCVVMEDLYCNE